MDGRSYRSKKKPWQGHAAVLVFALCFILTAWALPQMEFRPGGFPGKFTINNDADPGEDAFFVSRGEHELSHLALYHDIGRSIDHARNADILIIGNSRAQLGFSEKVMVGEAEKLGLKIFNLAVGHSDSARFARDLISRHDLKPLIVIANGGHFFYGNKYSNWASEVVNMSRWEANKTFFEYSMAWQLETRLHRHLPYLDQFERWRYPWTHYRSVQTGWWRNTVVPKARYPVNAGIEADSYKRSLVVARELKTELENRGAQLILSIAPHRKVRSGHLPYLSKELDIPYILVPFDGLETADSSHLTPASAVTFSVDIWQRFIEIPEVRAKLSLPAGT
ncbi:MAG: hypothetical protein ACJAYC_003632 [Halieaceae bacterium]|jgi:hypothetical protein